MGEPIEREKYSGSKGRKKQAQAEREQMGERKEARGPGKARRQNARAHTCTVQPTLTIRHLVTFSRWGGAPTRGVKPTTGVSGPGTAHLHGQGLLFLPGLPPPS